LHGVVLAIIVSVSGGGTCSCDQFVRHESGHGTR
jgi:hypothetical protein